MHYTIIKNHVISSHKELCFLNIHLHTLDFLMDDNVGAYSNSIKILFLNMFKYMMIHLIVSWCGFPIFYDDQRNNKYNFKTMFNPINWDVFEFLFFLCKFS
jgi:hypothetical protein